MTKQTNAEQTKRQSRGWSDAMDNGSIVKRLAKLEELYACWKTLSNRKKTPAVRQDASSFPDSPK